MENDQAKFDYVNDLRRLGISLGIYTEHSEFDAVGIESARRLEPGPDPKPSEGAIEDARNDLQEALLEVSKDKWIRPQTIVTNGQAPQLAISVRALEAALVARDHNLTVARWAIYRCAEAGELLAGYIELTRTVPAYRRRLILKDVVRYIPPRPGEPTTKVIVVTPEHLRDLFVSPTVRIRAVLDSAGSQPESIPNQKSAATVVAKSERVTLYKYGESPVAIVEKTPIGKLTKPQYDVVKALLDAGPDGLNKDFLVTNSKHQDARGILERLQKFPAWAPVIQLAVSKGHGYRIL
jgi:hypothetical protein